MNDTSEIFTLSGKTRLAGVIGWPVAHSLSPRLHGFWLRQYDIDGVYIPLPVEPENAESAIHALPKLGFQGANVTIPHKIVAFNCVDELTGRARQIGAVNTIICADGGKLIGDNTDGYGFLENLRAGAPQWRGNQGPAVVLGAGGAARAIVWSLLEAGVPEIRLCNRTREKAEHIAADFGAGVSVVDWTDRNAALADAELLVNTTSLGMTGKASLEITLNQLPLSAVVTDIVYAPLMTPLLEQAKVRGNTIVGGLGMLLHQGRPGFEAWFGVCPDVTPALYDFILSSAN